MKEFAYLERIELCNFAGREFSRTGMSELLEGISFLPCIRAVVLRNNGIDDSYVEEVEALFRNQMIKSIDLSQNKLRRVASSVGKLMKSEVNHVQWLDLSQNEFERDF